MTIHTQAIICSAAGAPWTLEPIQLEWSQELADQILVEMVSVGICHTDVKTAAGKFAIKPPLVLGHEGTGFVREVGKNVNHLKPGDAVVLSFASCATCEECTSGRSFYCDKLYDYNFRGTALDGSHVAKRSSGDPIKTMFFGQSSFSRTAIVHASCAIKVDVHSRNELKPIVLGCAFQTGAGAIMNVCQPPDGSSIAVFGCGGVGLSAIMAAKLSKPKYLIAIDVVQDKLQIAKSLGATHIFNSREDDVLEQLKKLTDGKGVNFVLDCVGSPALLAIGQKALASRGTLLTVGGVAENASLSITLQLQKGLSYRGCHQGDSDPTEMIPKLVKLWKEGKFPFDSFIRYYPFEQYAQALEDLHSGKTIKPVLTF